MKDAKKRYSIPAKLVELMWTNDEFFTDVSKIKKSAMPGNFPRNDQWKDAAGFHMEFALAGYSAGEVSLTVQGNVLTLSSEGLDAEPIERPEVKESDDAFEVYSKNTKTKVQHGFIVRGIARRKFSVDYLISEEFDVSQTEAYMKDGLLHIIIPEKEVAPVQEIEIIMGKD